MWNRNSLVFLVLVCLALILVAGCTSSTTTTSGPAGASPAATTTQVSTPAAASGTTAAASQDPIVGKWSVTGASGSVQVVFGADGSFTGYMNGGSQVMRSGTWQNIGGGKYSVTISGQSAPVTWVFDTTSNTAYNAAYPALVYSRAS